MKRYDNEFKIIIQYKYHHWTIRNVLYESWQVANYELRFIVARTRRKLRESVLRICTAYRGKSRVWFTRFEQRWNEDESSSVHRETDAFTMRVKTRLLEKQQQQQQRRQQQSYVNTSKNKVKLQKRKESFEKTKFGLWFLNDIRGEDIIQNAHLQVRLLRHHDRRHSEEVRATYWEVILLVLWTRECAKSQN